jgi:hypothetical protein
MSAKPSPTLKVVDLRDEDDIYFSEGEPVEGLKFAHFKKDRICTQCGLWKSEHQYDTCQNPQWQ